MEKDLGNKSKREIELPIGLMKVIIAVTCDNV